MNLQRINRAVLFLLGSFLGVLILTSGAFPGDSPGKIYREEYLHLKEAEKNFYTRDYEESLAGYKRVETALGRIRAESPEWSPKLVEVQLEK